MAVTLAQSAQHEQSGACHLVPGWEIHLLVLLGASAHGAETEHLCLLKQGLNFQSRKSAPGLQSRRGMLKPGVGGAVLV